MRLWAVVPAAGAGLRLGLGFNKVLAPLGGQPLLYRTLEALASYPSWAGVVLVHARDERMLLEKALEGASWPWPFHWAEGGETRSDSVRAGLTLATGLGAEAVAVHDAARPLVTEALVTRVVARAQSAGAAIPGLPVADTLKRVVRGTDLVVETVSRTELWAVQTPQVVRVSLLQEAYATAARLGITGTDEASLLEAAGFEVAVVPGDPGNVKVTGPGDLALVDALGVRLGRWSAPPDSGPTP